MRIGLIAPPWIPVPPPGYGGTEEVIDNLARGLTALGHDVVLFTVGESACPVPRQWLFASPAEPMGDRSKEAAHVLAAYEALAGEVDIIHDHTGLGLVLAGRRGRASRGASRPAGRLAAGHRGEDRRACRARLLREAGPAAARAR